LTICDKFKKLFHKEEKSHTYESYWNEPINYLGVSIIEIQKDPVVANKKITSNIEKLVKKLPKLSKEELIKERTAEMKSMNSEEFRAMQKLFPQDVYSFMRGHLKSYLDEIEKELKKRL
jgi:hypothetical protein